MSKVDEVNKNYAAELLFLDLETGEELRPIHPMQEEDGENVMRVVNRSGTAAYKYTLKIEDIEPPLRSGG